MRLSSAARNAASRCAVHASGLTFAALGSSTPPHGLTMILPGTAAFIAARSTAKARAMRAGERGLADFLRRFSPGPGAAARHRRGRRACGAASPKGVSPSRQRPVDLHHLPDRLGDMVVANVDQAQVAQCGLPVELDDLPVGGQRPRLEVQLSLDVRVQVGARQQRPVGDLSAAAEPGERRGELLLGRLLGRERPDFGPAALAVRTAGRVVPEEPSRRVPLGSELRALPAERRSASPGPGRSTAGTPNPSLGATAFCPRGAPYPQLLLRLGVALILAGRAGARRKCRPRAGAPR